MAQRLGFVFLIIFMLGFFDYVGTTISRSFSANGFAMAAAPIGLYVGRDSADSLSSVDFNLFSKNGTGWSYITQGYGRTPYSGWYVNGWHNGVDIAARYGAPIYSPRDGTVIATGNQDNFCPGRGFGKFIAVSDPGDNVVLWYAHLGQFDVSSGDAIKRGTLLGAIGNSGLETGTHLHFSVFSAADFSIKNRNGCGPGAIGTDLDPVPYLQKFAT